MQGAFTEPVEGAFAFPGVATYNPGNPSRFPITTMTAGPGQLVAAAGGCALWRFAWADPDGRVRNERVAAVDRLGFSILPYASRALNTWQRNYWDVDTKTYRTREGLEVVLLTYGAVWARFPGGAWPGSRVYASLVDGAPISGYADGAELTAWAVVTAADPGGLAIITTTQG